MPKKIYLVDTSHFIFRAYHALPPLTDPRGTPINAVYGFVNMVFRLLAKHRPDQIVFCLDSKTKGARYQMYPDYKANREEMPPDLAIQIPLVYEFLDNLGVSTVQVDGVEADDLIGSLALYWKVQGYHVVIVSGDKDFAQLVDDQVILYDSMNDVFYNTEGVIQKWGVPPSKMIPLLALTGDHSDNIPGVPGIGPKRAIQILTAVSSIDELYKKVDELKNILSDHVIKKLKEGEHSARISEKLVTINTQIDLPEGVRQLTVRPPNVQREKVIKFLLDHNFRSLLPQVDKIFNQANIDVTPNPLSRDAQISQLAIHPKPVTLDELTLKIKSQDPFWLVTNEQDQIVFIFESGPLIASAPINSPVIVESLSTRPLAGYDVKRIARKLELKACLVAWDHLLASYVLNPEDIKSLTELIQKTGQTDTWDPYQFHNHERLRQMLMEELGAELVDLLHKIEFPLCSILFNMERVGIKIDIDFLINESALLFQEIRTCEEHIYKLAGRSFNINSPIQLRHILFEKLNLPPPNRKTKTGFSTNSEVLENLRTFHPIVDWILKYRELSKLKSTYVDPLPQYADTNHRIHSYFMQTGTATGRLSSQNPNLQNIPIRTERGERLRQAFIAENNCLLGDFDYSQIELRILAHLSDDPALIKAFELGEDIHRLTASELFDVTLKSVTNEQRRIAKAVNFGILYGQGAFGLSESLHISQGEAKMIIDKHHMRFPRVWEFINQLIQEARKNGYVKTLFGRKRYLPSINSSNSKLKSQSERLAVNTPMQGSAADIVKLAMIKVTQNCKSTLVLQIHDELIFEAPQEVLTNELHKIKTVMESVYPLKVPLVVNGGIGTNWREIH
ncbi:MAG: DNA polymerase I [Bdellovibrionaceae bacterium]|nr:DNA polymerase I [Pseudobdellovibrionaceae bacterium]